MISILLPFRMILIGQAAAFINGSLDRFLGWAVGTAPSVSNGSGKSPDFRNRLSLLTKTSSNEQFAAVVMPHLDDAYALARWLTGNGADAEDVVQEACVRALLGLDGYKGGNARAWLLSITRNAAFTWLARNRPKALAVTEDIETLAPADGSPRHRKTS